MLQVEYLTLSIQLKLLSEKKDIFWQELEDARKDREVGFEIYSAQNTKRQAFSYTIDKLKEELKYVTDEKETSELSLAHIVAGRTINPRNFVTDLLPADIDAEHFEEVEIQEKEGDIQMLEKMLEDVKGRLAEAESKLKEFLFDKEILDKYRELCHQYQVKRQAFDEVVKDELNVAQKLLLIYRQLNPL